MGSYVGAEPGVLELGLLCWSAVSMRKYACCWSEENVDMTADLVLSRPTRAVLFTPSIPFPDRTLGKGSAVQWSTRTMSCDTDGWQYSLSPVAGISARRSGRRCAGARLGPQL